MQLVYGYSNEEISWVILVGPIHSQGYLKVRVRRVSIREKLEDPTPLELKMKEGISSGFQKREGNGFFPRASRRNAHLLTP